MRSCIIVFSSDEVEWQVKILEVLVYLIRVFLNLYPVQEQNELSFPQI